MYEVDHFRTYTFRKLPTHRVGEPLAELGHALDAPHAPPVLAEDLEVAVVVGWDGDLLSDGGNLPRALLELDALRQEAATLAQVDEEQDLKGGSVKLKIEHNTFERN